MKLTRSPTHRVAVVEEEFAAEALAILRQSAAWSLSRGIEVWRAHDLCESHLLQAARAGELVMGFTQGYPCATMLIQTADPLFWPDVPKATSLFLHKIAKRPAARRGWLARLVDFARREARSRQLAWLRLDTFHGSALKYLYEQQGFVALNEPPLFIEARWMIRMERRLRLQRAQTAPAFRRAP